MFLRKFDHMTTEQLLDFWAYIEFLIGVLEEAVDNRLQELGHNSEAGVLEENSEEYHDVLGLKNVIDNI